jgi:succinate-acetate transporter protein
VWHTVGVVVGHFLHGIKALSTSTEAMNKINAEIAVKAFTGFGLIWLGVIRMVPFDEFDLFSTVERDDFVVGAEY